MCQVRVADVSDESNADCSDPFYLLESEDVPNWMTKDGPFLYVTSPQEGDVAVAGDEYTVEVSLSANVSRGCLTCTAT